MKIIANFFVFSAATIGESLFDSLWELFPEGRQQGRLNPLLHIKVAKDDPRVETAMKMLYAAGFVPQKDDTRPKKPGEYTMKYQAVFEPDDIEAAEFLIPRPHADSYFPDYTLDSTGKICIDIENSLNGKAIGSRIAGLAGSFSELLVDFGMRNIFEGRNFPHVVFDSILLTKDDQPLAPSEQVYSRMASNLFLPPAIKTYLKNERGEPYVGDPKAGCYISDGLPNLGQLHYHRRDIEGIPPFGLALTSERFGPGRGPQNMLICSRDFYRFCVEQELRMSWIPVRIDD